MTYKNILLSLIACATLLACNGQNTGLKASSGGGTGSGNNGASEKPLPEQRTEKFQALIFQKPTQNPDEYSNVMKLDVIDTSEAWFSFTYAPSQNGSFFVTLSQIHLVGDCAKKDERSFSRGIFFQEVLANGKRVLVKPFNPNVTQYEYAAGKKYILTYALTDIKKDFSDCKSVTLKWATFRQID